MKLRSAFLQGLGLASLCHATRIYVSSYSGNITTVEVTPQAGGNLTLTTVAVNTGCSPSPSWLELDRNSSTLYCGDEGLVDPTNATFSSFKTSANGTLSILNKTTTLNGNVFSTIFGNDSVLALAEYGGSGITLVNISNPSTLTSLQTIIFQFSDPGNSSFPLRPFIHQTVIDPTSTFLLAPDLSADLVHIFAISPTYTLSKPYTQSDIIVPTGHGPRHGVFYQPGNGSNATYFYLVNEKANMVHTYVVSYDWGTSSTEKTIQFNMTQDIQLPVKKGSAAAEIRLTPDKQFIIVSSRNDTKFTIPNLDPSNSTQIISDSLFTFSISPTSGSLSLLQQSPSYGLSPRQFEISQNGSLVAVALNADNRLAIIHRDVESGMMGDLAGWLDLDIGGASGLVTCAVWEEDDAFSSRQGVSTVSASSSTSASTPSSAGRGTPIFVPPSGTSTHSGFVETVTKTVGVETTTTTFMTVSPSSSMLSSTLIPSPTKPPTSNPASSQAGDMSTRTATLTQSGITTTTLTHFLIVSSSTSSSETPGTVAGTTTRMPSSGERGGIVTCSNAECSYD